MKHLHIFAFDNIYCTFFQKFVEDNFEGEQHEFIYLQSKKQLSFFEKINHWKSIKKPLQKADKIFIHFLPTSIDLLFWFLNRKHLSKSLWSLWGRDVFYKDVKKGGFNKWLIERLRRSVIRRIGSIIGHPSDFDFLRKNYKMTEAFHVAFYPLPGLSFEEKLDFEEVEFPINILVGNSGDPSNRHALTFDLMEKYKNENVKIYSILSYGGTEDYRKKAADYGRKIFGDNFFPITEYMKIEEYKSFLDSIDITVMNQERQQGLGNIRTLLFQGKKIFMSDENTPFRFYKNELGFEISDVNEISEMDFNKFASMAKDLKIKNSDLSRTHFGNQNIKNQWGILFN